MARTFGTMVAEARTLLQDKDVTDSGQFRFSDDEIFEAINGAFSETRAKRPDLFIPWGLRADLPVYSAETDMNIVFPLDTSVYTPFLYYVCGRCELREDTFSNDARAVTLLNKFVSQLLGVQS
jgi:hypothetical protein